MGLPMLIHCSSCKQSSYWQGLEGEYVYQTLDPYGSSRIFHVDCVPDYFLALSDVEIRRFEDEPTGTD